MPLSTMLVGETRRISCITSHDKQRKRMLAMGLIPGSPVTVVGIVPAGVILEVRGAHLALSKEAADLINVF